MENMSKNTSYKKPEFKRYRHSAGAVIAGVCKGLSVHLDIDVKLVRICFVLSTIFLSASGLILYIWLWIFTPLTDKVALEKQVRMQQNNSLAKAFSFINMPRYTTRQLNRIEYVVYAIIAFSLLNNIYFFRSHMSLFGIGIALMITGMLLICVDTLFEYMRKNVTARFLYSPKYLIGVSVFFLGLVFALVGWGGDGAVHVLVISSLLGALSLFLVLLPVWVVLFKTLTQTQLEQAKEQERADIARHIHDGVLQTLSVIRKNLDDKEEIDFLCRTQERDLRAWLYGDRPVVGTSTAAVVRETIADIEDRYRQSVELVVVGDYVPNHLSDSFIKAMREAVINAILHGSAPVSVYVEFGSDEFEFYVRDRGQGFNLEQIPQGHFGVKESIINRIESIGGTVRIKNNNGCEISVVLPIAENG